MAEASADRFREFRYRSLWLLSVLLLLAFAVYAWRLLFLTFAGCLLGIVLRTFADWFERYTPLGPRSSYAATVCSLAILAALLAWLIVPNVAAQAPQIAAIIPASLKQARDYLDRLSWGRYLVLWVNRSTQSLQLTFVATILSQTLVAVIVIAVVGFYAGMSPGVYARALLSLVPAQHRARVEQVANDVVYALRWWLLGQLVPMVVLGAASMIGLWLLGVQLAFTLGLITGIMIFVPYLGTLLSEVPAVLVALKQGPAKALYVIILYLVLHVLEGYFLTPAVQRRTVTLLPILTVLSQILMWTLTGFLGVALATPLAATGLVLVKTLYLHQEVQAPGRK
jgi:predicted PurR-regulated permease PerM